MSAKSRISVGGHRAGARGPSFGRTQLPAWLFCGLSLPRAVLHVDSLFVSRYSRFLLATANLFRVILTAGRRVVAPVVFASRPFLPRDYSSAS